MLVRRIILVLAFLLGMGVMILSRLPTEAACVAAGHTVDPDRRRCIGPGGGVELREHILGHALDPVVSVPAGLVLAAGLLAAARRDRARRAAGPA